MLLDGIGVKDPPEYAVDDEVDAAVDGDQEVVGLRQRRELCLAEMLKYSRYNVKNEKGCFLFFNFFFLIFNFIILHTKNEHLTIVGPMKT